MSKDSEVSSSEQVQILSIGYDTVGCISLEHLDNLHDGITNLTKSSDNVVGNDQSDLDNLYNVKINLGSKSSDTVVGDDKSDFDDLYNEEISLGSKGSDRAVSGDKSDKTVLQYI